MPSQMGQTDGVGVIVYTGTRDELCQKLRARDDRISELEAALHRLWDVAQTVTVDGKRGCFVPEAEWRRLVVNPVHR